MNSQSCPSVTHFHVVYEQVGSFKRPHKTIEAADADEALTLFLFSLPKAWRGGVSVFDDSNCHVDEMPLLHAYV